MPRSSRLAAARLLPALLLLAPVAHADKARHAPPPQPAATYPMHQTDAVAHVTIAAEPGDTRETRPDTRLDYFGHGLLPLRVIVSNDSDAPLTLDDARIVYITADNTTVQAATLEELQRRLFTLKSATGRKVPLPLPIPVPITTGKSNIDKKLLADDADFSFQTTTVPPHSTVAGYLFYDMQTADGEPSPNFLSHATLELRKVRFVNPPAGANTYLDSFEIPLHPTASTPAK